MDAVGAQPRFGPHSPGPRPAPVAPTDSPARDLTSHDGRTTRTETSVWRRQPIGAPLTGHAGWVGAVAVGWLGDRDVIVSGRDGTVRVWDLHGQPTSDQVDVLEQVTGVSLFRSAEIYVASGRSLSRLDLVEPSDACVMQPEHKCSAQ